MGKFVILRVDEDQGGESVDGEVTAARVETGDLTERDARDLAGDDGILGYAPIMPTRLITPFAAAEVDAGDVAWGIRAVGAHDARHDGRDVTVAVLDTGIDAVHSAFADIDLEQRDFTGEGDGDRNGHGTHCAGTIFGRPVGGKRIGVAPGIRRALVAKVLGEAGGGTGEALFNAIIWALGRGARVISMSLGFDFPGMVAGLVADGWPVELATSRGLEAYGANLRLFDALMQVVRARAKLDGGAVVVAAAGNESRRQIRPDYAIAASVPAAALGVVSVGALEPTAVGLRVADFSNTLPMISAPGVAVESARPGGGLASLSGTSMATPHVAGLAALWWQSIKLRGERPNADKVAAALLTSARTDCFAESVQLADRGAGLAVAPRTPGAASAD